MFGRGSPEYRECRLAGGIRPGFASLAGIAGARRHPAMHSGCPPFETVLLLGSGTINAFPSRAIYSAVRTLRAYRSAIPGHVPDTPDSAAIRAGQQVPAYAICGKPSPAQR